ncbi:hypothetical protein FRC04_003418 [Tulasnella sp. 424]|nr:hypothetical protein FRC04_003418 [Tulasnella sp. 424]KAG8977227.1 hypothetical protein FRC05_002227 [Tulasnella sp. 425]
MQHILEELNSASRSTKVALAAATATSAAYLAYNHFSPSSPPSSIPSLRGPPSTSLISGNLFLIFDPDIDQLEQWLKEYGNVFAMPALFGAKGVYLADPKAVAEVTNRVNAFPKPPALNAAITRLTGPGLSPVEGDVHKRQRRIIQPAFSPAQIKQMTPAFVAKTQELKSIWMSQCSGGPTTINVLQWLDNLTLDIIGETALGYSFDSLHGSANELNKAFDDLLGETALADPLRIIAGIFPSVAKLPLKSNQVTANARAVLQKVGQEIVDAKKKELENLPEGVADELLGKDLLSVMIQSNMKEAASQRMTNEEVVARMSPFLLGHMLFLDRMRTNVNVAAEIATFAIAGRDTTASSTSWTLYALAKNPEIQRKLQEELLAFPHDSPTLDDLNSMKYLEWVINESLRRHPAAHAMQRTPVKDEVIPLSEPIVDRSGKEINEIILKAGESIFISMAAFNWSTKYWGPDAHEFKPERWANPPEESSVIPHVYANLISFLAGPRACIGWKFALAELKAILFVLLRAFDFEIDPQMNVKTKSVIATRPMVVGQETLGTRLPLIVKAKGLRVE